MAISLTCIIGQYLTEWCSGLSLPRLLYLRAKMYVSDQQYNVTGTETEMFFKTLTQRDLLALKVQIFQDYDDLAPLGGGVGPPAYLTAFDVIPGETLTSSAC